MGYYGQGIQIKDILWIGKKRETTDVKKEQDRFGYGQKGEGENRIIWIGDKKGMIKNGYGQEGKEGVG